METDQELATSIMYEFSDRTGLSSDAKPSRYLWTDAFALCNFLALYRRSGEERYSDLCARLVGQVHDVLGRHRADDPRSGWLSGEPDEEQADHPTRGGLRIGKPLPERSEGEQFDDQLEWDRDGQYFHYLTKWMDALARAATVLDQPKYARFGQELAKAVFPHFLLRSASGVPVGLAWKMSIDLSRPLTRGINPQDALDGYVTFRWLRHVRQEAVTCDLAEEIRLLKSLLGSNWTSSDPLGIGGLLLDAFRLSLLPRDEGDNELISDILDGIASGLAIFLRTDALARPADYRLGFRELGLAIGLQALPTIESACANACGLAGKADGHLDFLRDNVEAGRRIISFWSEPKNRTCGSWRDHLDINEVMLATALLEAQLVF